MNTSNNFYAALSEALMDRCGPQHEALVAELIALRERRGRLFVLGVGGGAANAAHAVNDFRKLCGIEAYAPTDGVAELTARTNDEGWHTVFTEWLKTSRISFRDAIMVFSVGGGHPAVSACIYEAVQLAYTTKARVLGVVGRSDGAAAHQGNAVVVVGEVSNSAWLTPITETAQVAVLHALVSDPRLRRSLTKW